MFKILFVGTDHALTNMTGKLLKRNGFNVCCAFGIKEALLILKDNKIDVIIADLEVSGKEITSFCHKVKQFAGKIKLLFITENEEDEIMILNAGADDWIKKPYQMSVLYARLNALLRQI